MDRQTTSRHRQQTSRTVRAAGRSPSGSARPGSGTRSIAKGSSSATRQTARPRSEGDGANLVLGGAVVAIIGLGWVLALALTAGGPGTADRPLALKLIPWVIVAAGLGLTVYGFWRLKPTVRA